MATAPRVAPPQRRLRRLGAHALSEPRLRVAFLRNRTHCLSQAEGNQPRASATASDKLLRRIGASEK